MKIVTKQKIMIMLKTIKMLWKLTWWKCYTWQKYEHTRWWNEDNDEREESDWNDEDDELVQMMEMMKMMKVMTNNENNENDEIDDIDEKCEASWTSWKYEIDAIAETWRTSWKG